MGYFRAVRHELFVIMTVMAVVSCARSELEQHWDDTLGSNRVAGGAAGAAPPAFAGRGGNAGLGGMIGIAGAAGSSFGGSAGVAGAGAGGAEAGAGGAAGGAGGAGAGNGGAGASGAGAGGAGAGGAGGSLHTLTACGRDATPILDGPFATQTKRTIATSVAGDWNRDGRLDIAVGNTDGSLSVLLGLGDGSFASNITYPSSLDPQDVPDYQGSIAASDLNGDGRLDLVLDQPQGVNVLFGAGDGSFASAVVYPLSSALAGLVLGDFDGNGHTDIALGGSSNEVIVLLGAGDGSFGRGIVTPVGSPLRYISAGDLNEDGRLDVLAHTDEKTAALLGDGQGRFVEGPSVAAGNYYAAVEVADFNADGHLDFARSISCPPRDGVASIVQLWLGQGDGSFSDGPDSSILGCLGRMTVADVNSDGAADVVSSAVTVMFGQRDLTTLPLVTSSKAGGGWVLGVADWNGDGKPDLATASDDWLAIHLGNGDGSFGSSHALATNSSPRSLTLADLNADGKLDLATTSAHYGLRGFASSTALNVFLGAGNGTFLDRVDYDTADDTKAPTATDLNGDGWQDLLTLAYGAIDVHFGKGNGSFGPETTAIAAPDISAFTIGDLNGDARPDLVTTHRWARQILLFQGLGDGTFASLGSLDLPDSLSGTTVVDVNGDGKRDVVTLFTETKAVAVLLGRGDGTFATGQLYPTGGSAIGDYPVGITPADLNGDGHVDLVTWGRDSLSVHLGSGDGSFARRLDYPGKANQLAALDFNRDGHQDLIMVHDAGLMLFFGAGDGTFTCFTRYLGNYVTGLGVGDLNQDQRLDVVTTTDQGVNVFLNSTP